MKLLKILKKITNTPDFLKSSFSFAQEGEDLILADIFSKKNKGFYVDIGAHDPVRFSNTKIFYDKGWNGINIEPDPNQFQKFLRKRPRDININCGIGQTEEKRTFYIFKEPALNSFNQDNVKKYQSEGYELKEKREFSIQRLDHILKDVNHKIDFMNIDVEGLEMEVLSSNNWNKNSPQAILIEIHQSLENLPQNPIYNFLKSKNYTLIAKTTRTAIFVSNI